VTPPVKTLALIGVLLIAVGVIAVVYGGITYTTREDVVQVGPIEVTAKTKKTFPLPPVLGATAIVVGVILIVRGGRKD